MSDFGTIRMGRYSAISTKDEIKRFKSILDRLELPHIIDNVCFHNSLLVVNNLKLSNKTNVWKVEKDGSVSLTNQFGHNHRFRYRYLKINSLHEFQYVDLSILKKDDLDFLFKILFDFELMDEDNSSKIRKNDSD